MDSGQKVPLSLEVGVVVKPHGVRGAVKVKLFNQTSRVLQETPELVLRLPDGDRTVRHRIIGQTAEFVLLTLDGQQTRDQADALRGAQVLVQRHQIEPPDQDQFFYADLLGCKVLGEAGQVLGSVVDLFDNGASDILVVHQEEMERLIPFVEQWIDQVDLQAKEIRVLGSDQWEPVPIK